jgi:hypothetical protein
VNHHRQKIVDIGHQTFFHSLFFPPLEKGGEGGFKIREIPLNPPLPKGEVNKGFLKTAPKGPPLPGEVPDEA